jgi:hypothetical protein
LLWKSLADELASWCCTSATFDCKTVEARSNDEGLSFLTITLPNFGKDFEKGLDQGFVDRRLFTGFQWKAGLPRFLGGFLGLVFERDSGVLLDEPNIDAILAIRQLTRLCGKMLVPCSDTRERAAMSEFLKCEQEIREADRNLSPIDLEAFRQMSALLFTKTFNAIDHAVYYGELVPKHGPGATADRLKGNRKYEQRTWTTRLEKYFPAGEYLLPNWSYYDLLGEIDFLEPDAETPVRVVSVPKTLKTPRIIAIEPTAMQYAQQAVLLEILDALKKNNTLDRMIGFDDQAPNQRLARTGSQYGDLATLDLSEASDRVSNQLVREMTAQWPNLHGAVDACRSRKADVQGKTIRLSKFASMGSALCFPFEAMVFTTVVFLGIQKSLNTTLTWDDIQSFSRTVRIYGDDIIVPVDHVRSVVSELEAFGFRVNHSKSFWTGKFRESCGKEYFDGFDVSIVKVRYHFPTSRKDATEVISLISLRNQLYYSGYWQTTKWLDGRIRKLIHHFPTVLPTSPVLGRHSFLSGYETHKLSENTHAPMVKGYVVRAILPKIPLSESGALLKYFLKQARKPDKAVQDDLTWLFPVLDEDHLERSGRPLAVNIKLGYGSAT